jgi:hypothetical protein
MRFEMVVKMLREKIDVKSSCRVLGVSRSGFYAWLKRPKSKRDVDGRELIERMRKIHEESRGTYGAPRITEALKALGRPCGHNRVARLMRKAGLFGCAKRRFRVITTDSNHDLPIAPRVFQVEKPASLPTKPNQVWVGDITYGTPSRSKAAGRGQERLSMFGNREFPERRSQKQSTILRYGRMRAEAAVTDRALVR